MSWEIVVLIISIFAFIIGLFVTQYFFVRLLIRSFQERQRQIHEHHIEEMLANSQAEQRQDGDE